MKKTFLIPLLLSALIATAQPKLVMDETTLEINGKSIVIITHNEQIKDSLTKRFHAISKAITTIAYYYDIVHVEDDSNYAILHFPLSDSALLSRFIDRMNAPSKISFK